MSLLDQSDGINPNDPVSAGEEGSGSGQKRRRVTRRPLSCTECKRRKTKCSSMGITPCTSCVRRGKPDECRWENMPVGTQQSENMFALSSEVEILRGQVQELYRIVNTNASDIHHRASTVSPIRGSDTAISLSGASEPSHYPRSSTVSSSADNTPLVSSLDRQFETSVSVLERLAEGSEGTLRPASKLRSICNSQTPFDPSPFVNAQASRLPRMLDQSTRHVFLLDHVYDILPEHTITSQLVDAYFCGALHRGWHVVHVPSFQLEYTAFVALGSHVQRLETDPAWIALLLMVLALGLQTIAPEKAGALFPLYCPDDLSNLPHAFYRASMLALDVGKCDVVPQIRHVQVTLLCIPFLFHFGSGSEDSNAGRRHLSAGITTAEWLGLDQLGSDPAKAPVHDPAFCHYSAYIAFEISKRLYHLLAFLDGTAWKRSGLWRLAQATTGALATDLPRNLNDEDLLDATLPDRPSSEITHSTISRIGSLMAKEVRTAMQVCHHGGEMTYKQVLEYDAALRGVLEQLPSPLTITLSHQNINWMQVSLFTSIHHRFLRVHRPYMMRGYDDDFYQRSTLRSVECARNIISAQRTLVQWPALRPWFSKHWILRAALVLTVDWVVSIERAHPSDSIASKRLYVADALYIFHQHQNYTLDKTPQMTVQCAKIITALLLVADQHAMSRQTDPCDQTACQSGKTMQEFFDAVSVALHSGPDEVATHHPNIEQSNFSVFDFFHAEVQTGYEQSDDVPFDFSMFEGWEGLDLQI